MKKRKIVFICIASLLLVFLLSFYFLMHSRITDRITGGDEKISELCGKWKVTRLIQAGEHVRGDLLYGNETGRAIIISEDKIIDSKKSAQAEQEGQACFGMKIDHVEKKILDISVQEVLKDFQIEHDFIFKYAGITDNKIMQYTFYADKEEERSAFECNEFIMFSYSMGNSDIWVGEFTDGCYLMERYEEQKEIDNIYGKWMVERLTSRGNGESFGIDFLNWYGAVMEIMEDGIAIEDDKQKILWSSRVVDTIDFEKEHGIRDGLGLETDKIEVWYGDGTENEFMKIIPIDSEHILAPLDNQWFLLKRINKYTEPEIETEKVIEANGNWKPSLLISEGDVNRDLEASLYLNPFWWYAHGIDMDTSLYTVEVSDWEIEEMKAQAFYEQYHVPGRVRQFFSKDDILHIAKRTIGKAEEVYIILDAKTMIRGRNHLWFRIERTGN